MDVIISNLFEFRFKDSRQEYESKPITLSDYTDPISFYQTGKNHFLERERKEDI